jgi:hypothetical protein
VADTVIMTGALTDDEMVAVVQGAELAVMASFEEGFGLPVLEAAACSVPAIASDVSSLPEVLTEPAAGFDPSDPAAIAAAIERGLLDERQRARLLDAGRRAVQRWTWRRAAETTMATLATTGPRRHQRITAPRRRLAVAGRFGADTGDVGVFNAGLVQALEQARPEIEVVALVDSTASLEPTRAGVRRWPVRAVDRFVKPWDLDAIVAVLGDPATHVATAQLARREPCHLWMLDDWLAGAEFAEWATSGPSGPLGRARSIVVGSDESALLVRAAHVQCPVHVAAGSPAESATAVLAAWLVGREGTQPSGAGHG